MVNEARPPSWMIDVYDFDSQSVLMRYHCDDLIRDAQNIGGSLITELQSLGNRRITYFHTWNDADEDKAGKVAEIAAFRNLSQNPQLPNGAKAQHLLAGAIMAAYANPGAFDEINRFLNEALSKRAAHAFNHINKFLNAFTA